MDTPSSETRPNRSAVSRRTLLKTTGAVGLAAAATRISKRSAFAAPVIRTTQNRAAAQVSGKITLAYLGTADQAAAWDKLFAQFRQQYPNIELEAQPNAIDNWAGFFDAISTQIAGGKVPDIIQVATEGQRLFASRNLCLPINDLLERDKDELADYFADVSPKLLEWDKTYTIAADGSRYYLPSDFNTMCYWYNADVLNAAGIPAPTDDWTWDTLMAMGEPLKAKGIFTLAVAPTYFVGIMPFLLTNGASSMSADWATATINSPQAIEAATFMRTMVANGYSPIPGGTFDAFTTTAQDKMAAFGGGRWPIINIRKLNAVDKMKIVAWPQKTQKGSPVGWNAYPIMKESKNVEAAWAFVKFMTSAAASQFAIREGGGTVVPGRKSVATSQDFLDNAPEGMDKLYTALDYATPIPSPDKGNVIQSDIEDAFTQILTGAVSPEDGLNALNDSIQGNL